MPKTNNAKKVKFDFHISYKVFTTTVRSAKLWLYLTRPKVPRKATSMLIIRDFNSKNTQNKPYVITRKLKDKEQGWISIDVEDLISFWKRRSFNASQNIRDLDQNSTLEITCTHCGYIAGEAVGSNKNTKPFIVVDMTTVKQRKKRSLDCRPGINTCCRQLLRISFTDIGWGWILVPHSFDMNYCTGSCYGHILPINTHSSFLQQVALYKKRKDMAPCCTPTKLAALSMLVFDPYMNINQVDIPNMTVEECSCS